jgi:adenylate cyclase
MEHELLDLAYRSLGPPSSPRGGSDIVLLLIDSKSLTAMKGIFDHEEPWPWRRLFYGALADFLRRSGARALALDLDLSGPTLYDYYEDDSEPAAKVLEASGIAYLAFKFTRLGAGDPRSTGVAGAEMLEKHALAVKEEARLDLEDGSFDDAQWPYGPLSRDGVFKRLGFANAVRDPGGALRRTPLLVRYQGRLHPSLALSVFLDLREVKRIGVTREGRLELDDLSVPLDPDGRYLINWYGPEQTFPSLTIHQTIRMALADHELRCPPETCADPLYWNNLGFSREIRRDEIDAHADLFRGKIVLVGANVSILGDLWSNPFSEALPGVEVHATVLKNLLDGQMLERGSPAMRVLALLFMALACGAGTTLAGGEKKGLGVFAVAICGHVALFAWCFSSRLLWLDLGGPVLAGCLAYGAATLASYFTTGRQRRQLRKTFDRVLQPALIDLLLREPERLNLGGETRELTVLFSDLKDSTALAESLSPKDLVAALNRYFSKFTDSVVSRGAYLDKFIGDGVMAVWGAPVPREEHAADACIAALELKSELEKLSWVPSGEQAPLTRMGIHSGEMVAGMVGGQGIAHYTVMGDSVVVASRLEGANKVYGTQILVGEGCRDRAKERVAFREIDRVVLKGKSQALRVYEPVGLIGALSSKDEEKLAAFAAALKLYRDKRWRESAAAFEQVLAVDPADGPARVFVQRCLAFMENEPPPDWRGEFIMHGK